MVLLKIEKGEWKTITKDEKNQLPKEEQEKVLYLDGLLKKKLDFAISQQAKNNDVVGIVAGDEGSGKSALAGNMMRYISKDKFDPRTDMVGADYEDGVNKIMNRKQKGWLMFDEGNIFFLSTEVMKKEQRNLHKLFSIFRQKNLFVLIVLPSFFRLNTYFALDRSRFLVRSYLKKGQRSFFAFYGQKKKKKLWNKGKQYHNYNASDPSFRGRFTICNLLEDEEYKKFKLDTLNRSLQSAIPKKEITPTKVKQHYLHTLIKKNKGVPSQELAKYLHVDDSGIRRIRREMEKQEIAVLN